MGDNSYRNYAGPSQEYSLGDIDPVSNHVGEVVRTYTNATPEFIRLVFEDGRDDLVATPGHAFKTETGDYLEIGIIAQLGGGTVRLVDIDGAIVAAKAERLVYSAETAHLFATSVSRSMSVAGNLAFKEDVTEGWATHNFEVRSTHNYVAGDIRVHNQSGPIGQLGNNLDTNRLSGVRDGDGSFLDKASNLINGGLHIVDRAIKNVSAGFFNIGNSIAAGVTGVAVLIAGGISGFFGNFAHASSKIVAVTSLTMVSACSWDYTLQKPVKISGNCDREAITAALDGKWRAQYLSLVELSKPSRPNKTYAGIIEKKRMNFLLHDFVKELNDLEQCFSIANYTYIPFDSRFGTMQGQVGFLIRLDQSVCLRTESIGGRLYCLQENIGGNK